MISAPTWEATSINWALTSPFKLPRLISCRNSAASNFFRHIQYYFLPSNKTRFQDYRNVANVIIQLSRRPLFATGIVYEIQDPTGKKFGVDPYTNLLVKIANLKLKASKYNDQTVKH